MLKRNPFTRRNPVFFPAVLVLLLLPFSCQRQANPASAQGITSDREAFTITGEGVTLRSDGTWTYSGRRGVYEVDTNGLRSYRDADIGKLLPAVVKEVYDGDTLTVEITDPPPGIQKTERIRLLGIDTPELDAAGSTPAGKGAYAYPAKDYTSSLVLSKTVYLAFESAWRDRFSRLLCYAYLEDGSLLNARILSEGFAAVFTDIRCVFQDEFLALEAAARKSGLGIWIRGKTGGIVISTIHNEGTREFIELINMSGTPLDLSGWKIEDSGGNVLTIPSSPSLPPGGVFRIYSGSDGIPSGTDSAYPTTRQIWNNGGDTATLFNLAGSAVDRYSY